MAAAVGRPHLGSLSQPTSSLEKTTLGYRCDEGGLQTICINHHHSLYKLIKGEKTHNQRLPLLGSIETGLELVLLLLDGAFLLTHTISE